MARGRKPDREVWRKLLLALGEHSLKEIRGSGEIDARSLRHYVREMLRRGFIEPARFFSHLPEDGPGAKRFTLTEIGKRALQELEEGETTQIRSPVRGRAKDSEPSKLMSPPRIE